MDRRQQKKLVASMEQMVVASEQFGSQHGDGWTLTNKLLATSKLYPGAKILEIINNNRIYLLDFVRRLLCVLSSLCILFPTMTSSSETDLPEKAEADSPSQAPSQHLGQENL